MNRLDEITRTARKLNSIKVEITQDPNFDNLNDALDSVQLGSQGYQQAGRHWIAIQLATAKAEIEKLKGALEEYGLHKDECAMEHGGDICDCGYHAAFGEKD
jgi:hypothetical protein